MVRKEVNSRNTIQRALVLEAVQSLWTHPTSAEVYAKICEKHRRISPATVYRNLDVLADQGAIQRIRVHQGADRYDRTLSPHYHSICRVCGKVSDVEMPYQAQLPDSITDLQGFRVENHHLMFEGVCRLCQEHTG